MDVLCIGHAAHDLTMTVNCHPQADEKLQASLVVADLLPMQRFRWHGLEEDHPSAVTSATGALACTRLGAREGLPTDAEVETLLRRC